MSVGRARSLWTSLALVLASAMSCSSGDSSADPGLCEGVVCAAQDACHAAGVCDGSTGECTNPVVRDGTACDDGSACTRDDTCQAGVCTGGDPVVCTAQDQCHGVGVCDRDTGACSDPALDDGSACDDGDPCTQGDTCQAGVCTGGSRVCP
ncbi:MAG: hypothetical protein JST92_03200 [Deltaproteobacteria bacterium]|nr:hypothetical protein [Deltaproteobacteria bacterium]